MQNQDFKNHSRLVPLFHGLTFSLLIVPFVFSIIWFIKSIINESGRIHAGVFVCLCLAAILVAFFARTFALKAQDRAIRAEENLRYFAITGNLLDSKLRMSQIVALRFAPNNEFVDLAHRAVAENLSNKEIKMAIKHWKGDYNRV